MNIIEQLKNAIENQSWSDVCDIYKSMTGQNIKCPDICNEFSDRDMLKTILTNALSLLSKEKTKIANNQPIINNSDSSSSINIKSVTDDNEEDAGLIPPSELLSEQVSKSNIYGGSPELVTTAIDQKEFEENKKRSIKTVARKSTRPPPTIYEVECSKCGKIFESPFPTTKDVGMSCTKCIMSAKPGK